MCVLLHVRVCVFSARRWARCARVVPAPASCTCSRPDYWSRSWFTQAANTSTCPSARCCSTSAGTAPPVRVTRCWRRPHSTSASRTVREVRVRRRPIRNRRRRRRRRCRVSTVNIRRAWEIPTLIISVIIVIMNSIANRYMYIHSQPQLPISIL